MEGLLAMPPPFTSRATVLDSFLTEIVTCIERKNGSRITELIQLDFDSLSPERQKPYADLNQELNKSYPAGNDGELVTRCKNVVSQDEFGTFSTPFSDSIIHYFRYLRDFTRADDREKAIKIRQLTSQCVTALGDSRYGVIMIPIVLSFSRTLATIATYLDRNRSQAANDGSLPASQPSDSAPGKFSFVEDAANVLRDAFIKCLAGSPGVQRTTRPASDDKRVGIYLTANSCLKLLTQCGRLRNAQQMFSSIDAQSPPLAYYPAAQRVTYLYYLGRYHFANNHFYRAQSTLQAAYAQCHRDATKHRRLILVYLMASNLCLGRFPSTVLLSRPEAKEIGSRFVTVCKIIQNGDLGGFHQYLDLSSESGRWFLRRSILLQLQNRCEILVWRSLIRNTFRFSGYMGEEKKVPFLRLHYVQHAAAWSMHRIQPGATFDGIQLNGQSQLLDSEFEGVDEAINETGFHIDSGHYDDEFIGQHTQSVLIQDSDVSWPKMSEVESVVLSLIQQGLLKGFALHINPRFAIPGSQKAGGPMKTGFPEAWRVISANAAPGQIPGWVEVAHL